MTSQPVERLHAGRPGPAAPAGRASARPLAVVPAFLPAALAAVGMATALFATDTPVAAVAEYTAYLLVGVLVPGTLVHRALRGRSPLLFADLSLGAATGLALELAAWGLFTWLQIQRLLWLWPLLVIVPFLSVGSLRRHWRLRPPGALVERSAAARWLAAGAVSWLALSLATVSWRHSPLPPHANAYSLDIYWHLSIAIELTRQVPPEIPQVAGRTLRAHWFANAHLAAGHEISGVSLSTIILRLWLLPVVVIMVGLLVSVARRVTGSEWPGGLAAVLLVAPAMVGPWPWFEPYSSSAIVPGSPTLMFGVVFLLLAADVLIDLVRGRALGRGWFILLLAIAAAPGSKPAVLPVLCGGLLLVVALNLLQRRPVRGLLVAILAMGASIAVYSPQVAQSTAGSSVKIFGLVTALRPWRPYIGGTFELPGTGGYFLSGVETKGAYALMLLLVAALLVQYVVVLAGLPLLRRETRSDPALWFLGGGVLAGLIALLVVDHPGASEVYFAKTATPLGLLLAAWGVAVAARTLAPRGPTARTLAVWAVGAAGGIAAVLLARGLAPTPTHVRDSPAALAVPFGVLLGCAAAGVVAWHIAGRSGRLFAPAQAGAGTALCCAALVAAVLVPGTQSTLGQRSTANDPPTRVVQQETVTAAEGTAAGWVDLQVPATDVVATNVHCRTKVTRPRCDARAFWVSALGGHRVLVEGWAYTVEALQRQGRDGQGFVTQPFDDAALFEANEKAFTAPTKAALDGLYRDHTVRWLFADRLAGPVSPALGRLATLRLRTADVSVYQLRSP